MKDSWLYGFGAGDAERCARAGTVIVTRDGDGDGGGGRAGAGVERPGLMEGIWLAGFCAGDAGRCARAGTVIVSRDGEGSWIISSARSGAGMKREAGKEAPEQRLLVIFIPFSWFLQVRE